MGANSTTLAARLARGDDAAFAELYDACVDRLYGYLTRRLGCTHQAADVVQNAFLRAVEHRKQFAKTLNPVAYLFQIARNEATRYQTRNSTKRRRKVSIDQTIAAPIATGDETEFLNAALARLDSDDREIVELKIHGGLTFEEIGQVMERPAATAATQYRRALESLRHWLVRQMG
jgi:RNA polymerase sigma-70 factor (ECF subfamily)